MKNKEGLEIKVGQVWLLTEPSKQVTVDAITENGFYYVECEEECVGCMHANSVSLYVDTLISDPDWGDMTAWKLVTDEQKEKCKVPKCAQFWHIGGANKSWYGLVKREESRWMSDKYMWRVPADFDDWQPVAPKKPQYRLFEMDWNEGEWCVIKQDKRASAPFPGYITDDKCRIFGFTDDPGWRDGEPYEVVPCNSVSNFKYAIGRLEE
jgi:hypothetical protein